MKHQALMRNAPLYDRFQLPKIQRFRLEIVSTLTHRLRGELHVGVVSDNDNADLRVALAGMFQQFHTVDRVDTEFRDHYVNALFVEKTVRRIAVFRPKHLKPVAFHERDELSGIVTVLVDNESPDPVGHVTLIVHLSLFIFPVD